MKIGFTGTREGMTDYQKEQFALKIIELGISEFHHGDCIGADAEAHDIVRFFRPNVRIICHPPRSDFKRAWRHADFYHSPLPYLQRDRKIVDSVDYLIATPLQNKEIIRSGTWTTIRYAKKISRSCSIILRQGL